MEDRAKILRRRIDAYRCYLAVGSDIVMVRQILREIAIDEAELAAIADGEQASARPPDEAFDKEAEDREGRANLPRLIKFRSDP